MNQYPKSALICGIHISNMSYLEVIDEVDRYISASRPIYIVTPNVDHIVNLQKDHEFKQIYYSASLVLADGVPILWAARFLRLPIKEKISGSDLFTMLCEIATEKGYKFFFLGGKERAAAKAAEVLRVKYPAIQIVGVYCPPFGFENNLEENNKIVDMITVAKPDILFVGVGSPKQEKWIYRHKDEYQVPVSIGVGSAFDFYSGIVKRAPVWMQKTGLEWFWRLMMEPKRLWKRYLIDDPIFFWLVLKQKLGLLK